MLHDSAVLPESVAARRVLEIIPASSVTRRASVSLPEGMTSKQNGQHVVYDDDRLHLNMQASASLIFQSRSLTPLTLQGVYYLLPG